MGRAATDIQLGGKRRAEGDRSTGRRFQRADPVAIREKIRGETRDEKEKKVLEAGGPLCSGLLKRHERPSDR